MSDGFDPDLGLSSFLGLSSLPNGLTPPLGTLPLLGNPDGGFPGFPLLLFDVSVPLYFGLLSGFVFGLYLFKLLGTFLLLLS